MFRVMPVFGTRPEAIKMAPLVKALEVLPDVDCTVCVTAQHREMLDQVLSTFSIQPQYDLNVMQASQTLSSLTSRVILGMERVLEKARPDLLLVHGDTTTSMAAALAAFYQKVPVGHVEAGLRSYDNSSPFPEEMNRTITARIAELHFAPTETNRQNLLREGVDGQIFVTGNTVVDALMEMVSDDYSFSNLALSTLVSTKYRLILMTAHRRENLGEPLKNICRAVKRIVTEFDDVVVVYPVHLNPAVRECVWPILYDVPRVHLIDPIDVRDMHNLMNRSYLVMTDSGGLQEEAPALGKPVIVLRKETERHEICAAGKAILAGVDEQCIYENTAMVLSDVKKYNGMCRAANPYGDGKASERISDAIRYWAGFSSKQPEEFNS